MKAKAKKAAYTVAQLRRYMENRQRQEARERATYGQEMYARGVKAGREAVVGALHELLELDTNFVRRNT